MFFHKQLEEERKIAEQERAIHNDELHKLKGQLDSNSSKQVTFTSKSDRNHIDSIRSSSTVGGPASVSWIGGFLSYFFQANNISDNSIEVLTV